MTRFESRTQIRTLEERHQRPVLATLGHTRPADIRLLMSKVASAHMNRGRGNGLVQRGHRLRETTAKLTAIAPA